MINVIGNILEFNGKIYKCGIGKNGFSESKIEGDNCTPIGTFPLLEVFYKNQPPITALKTTKIEPHYGWCDDVASPLYNQLITLPNQARHEKMLRDDNLYDIVVVIGYNLNPIVTGKGSAIFMHIAKPNYCPTEGCISLAEDDLLQVLAEINESTSICIKAK